MTYSKANLKSSGDKASPCFYILSVNHYFRKYFKRLKLSDNYTSQLPQQSLTLFNICGFFMFLSVKSVYFRKQHGTN
jgi:hypothetical protein